MNNSDDINKTKEQLIRELELLRQQNEEMVVFKEIYNAMKDGVVVADDQGRVLLQNKIAEDIFNSLQEEPFQQGHSSLFVPEKTVEESSDDLKGFNEREEGRHGNKSFSFSCKLDKGKEIEIHKILQREIAFKDTGILCEYKNVPLRNNEGKVIGVLGIARDISFRRQMEELIKSYARQKGIIAQIGTTVLSETSIENLFVEVVSLVKTTFDVDYCNILEFFPDKKELVILAGIGWEKERKR